MIKKESRNSMRVARHERIRKNISEQALHQDYVYSVQTLEFTHKSLMMKTKLLLYLLPH